MIKNWTAACPKCQTSKITRHNRTALCNFPESFHRFRNIHADLVGPLPQSQGHRYILTMRDRSTGFCIAAPLHTKTSKGVIKLFQERFIAVFGIPSVIITDRGGEFVSNVFNDFCNNVGILHKKTTAFHPQSNGFLERQHRIIKTALRALEDKSKWAKHLPFIMLSINNMVVDKNYFTPYQMCFGQQGQLFGSCRQSSNDLSLPDISNCFAFMENMRFHKKISRPLPNNKPFIEKRLSKCSNVWVRNNAPSGPLAPLYNGPYKVLNRYKKYFTILCNRIGPINVTIDRLKACVTLPTLTEINDSDSTNSDQSSDTDSPSNVLTETDQYNSDWESEIDD